MTIVQDPRYHDFADGRTLYGVPNFWNVISNVPFLLVALYGIAAFRSRTAFTESWERIAYATVLAGTAAVAIGSGYYHLHPDDARLFCDRLPMTVVFMSLVASIIGERAGMRAGRRLLWPLVLLGMASVVYWRVSGNLLPYVIVQFGSMLVVPVLLLRFPARYTGTAFLWGMIVLYVAAKILECFDDEIGTVIATGGHPWKHLAAAAAMFLYVIGIRRRTPLVSEIH